MATDAQSERRPAVSLREAAAPADRGAEPPAWLIWNLALMVLVSAFLLFQVQPLISKFILPWFGGSPAVWTTCMLFFQSALFFGYAYAHLTSRWLSCRQQAILHGVLILAALAMLPIAPRESWKPAPGEDPTWRILALLTATVGLPYFVLSATGPLSQAWFSRAYAHRSPYRIYALSNVGSLAALVTFPFVFEPAFTAETQAWLWSGAFVLFGVLCAGVAIWIGRYRGAHAHATAAMDANGARQIDDDRLSILRRSLWIALPALSTIMLLATTNHVCQNFAPVPFLWVVPLSLYLLSFIVCFDHERWYRRGPFSVALAIFVFLSAGGGRSFARMLRIELPAWFSGYDADWIRMSFVQELVMYFTTLFLICMVCHGELVRLRPKPKHLTEFYLMISGGGALGGLLVSLVAPHVFDSFLEWNLGLIVSFVLAGALAAISLRFDWIIAIGLLLVTYWQVDNARLPPEALFQHRNFYGLVRVNEVNDDGQHYMQFKSGRISHGRQWVSDDRKIRLEPTSYYSRDSGVGHAVEYHAKRPEMKIGVVGLGAGTMAAYATKPGHEIKFYEINPEVITIANDYFTFLRECGGKAEVVLGDARLSMEREPPQNFDVLVLDAFSGDAPPVHLLTREAFAEYKRHLKPDGIIAVNIKNQYIQLAPVIKAAADYYGYHWTRRWTNEDSKQLIYDVDWMMLTNDEEFLKANPPVLDKDVSPEVDAAVWTDHYSNLFQLLMRK